MSSQMLRTIISNRRNLISTSPTTQSVSTKQVNARNWLNNRIEGLNSKDFLPDSITIYTNCIAMPDEFSDVTDIIVNRRNSISTSPITRSVSTEQVNARNWLNERFRGLNPNDFLPDSIAIYTNCNGYA